ncbi:helix-turn-helix transcriptional regulator [Bacillaceae bacterium S4-13-58]
MHVGRRLAAIRVRHGISQDEMAKDIISRGHYSNIESGRYQVMDDLMQSFAIKIKLPISYLRDIDVKDEKLESDLLLLDKSVEDKDFKRADQLVEEITENYPYINSIEQEFYFYLIRAGYYLLNENMDEAQKILEEKIKIYANDEEAIPNKYLFLYYYTMGLWYQQSGIFPISEEYYEKASNVAESNIQKAKLDYNRAMNHYSINKLKTAVSFATRSLGRYMEEEKMQQIAKIYVLLGALYWELEMLAVSESVLMKGLEVTKTYKYSNLEEKIYNNLGLVYGSRNDFKNAMVYFNKSIDLKVKNNYDTLVFTYINLLEFLISAERSEESIEILNKVKKLQLKDEEQFYVMESEAKLNFLLGNYDEYERLIEKVIRYYDENNHYRFLISICRKYSDYLATNYKYKDAYHYAKVAFIAQDKLKERRE